MADLMQILRFAVATTSVVILVDGAAVDVQDKFAGQNRFVSGTHVQAVFDRDFDFGEITTVGH